VIDYQLVLPAEQIFKGKDGPFRPMEHVFLVELHHGQFSKLRGEGIAGTNKVFLLLEEGPACRDPFVLGDSLDGRSYTRPGHKICKVDILSGG
jgi:hypothetical protein